MKKLEEAENARRETEKAAEAARLEQDERDGRYFFFRVQIWASYSGWSIDYNNVGCLARLKTSFELNPVTEGKQWNFPFLSFTRCMLIAGTEREDGEDVTQDKPVSEVGKPDIMTVPMVTTTAPSRTSEDVEVKTERSAGTKDGTKEGSGSKDEKSGEEATDGRDKVQLDHTRAP